MVNPRTASRNRRPFLPIFGTNCALLALTAACGSLVAQDKPGEIPITAGVTFVLAVNDYSTGAASGTGIVQGDYEMVVGISAVSAGGITHAAAIDGFDAAGVRRRGSIPRVVVAADLESAPVQVFGFHSDDPPIVRGTTALGPSRAVTRSLRTTGAAVYAFRNFVGRDTITGTLQRSARSPVKFPVLVNGRRVELDAIHATGQMALGDARRPFETVILDHPQYPISLRIAYGPRDGGFPFKPEFAREVVRIDSPRVERSIADALDKDCRVELHGIYFDFNQATIRPESARALKEIAAAVQMSKQPQLTLEGHTDSIGSDTYNDDLSGRRAAAVKDALIRDHGVNAAKLATAAYGERRPVESNDTLSGRARNRRVELVCAMRR